VRRHWEGGGRRAPRRASIRSSGRRFGRRRAYLHDRASTCEATGYRELRAAPTWAGEPERRHDLVGEFEATPLPHGTATPTLPPLATSTRYRDTARAWELARESLHMIPDVQTTCWYVEMGASGRTGGVITKHHSIPFGRARELTSWPLPLKKHIGVLSICVHMEQGPPACSMRLVALGTAPGAARRAPVRNRAPRARTGVLQYPRYVQFQARVPPNGE
jgi:hypothetical protein